MESMAEKLVSTSVNQVNTGLSEAEKHSPLGPEIQGKKPASLSQIPQLSRRDIPALLASTLFWKGRRLGKRGLLLESQVGVPEAHSPLFFVGYEEAIAQNIDARFPVYVLPGGIIPQDPANYIGALAACYVDEILSVQPQGPYFLGGYCFGGLVAFEMAQQLQTQGHEVAWLTIIDIGCPTTRYLNYRE
ncbi:MAG: hypothetical protein F6K42_10890, partial [Leptolyngbya sp. SIO1D8]|nr:hypothetical protein [Leptolyngbya sp. SIO1D8]